MKQKGLAPIVIVLLIAAAVGGYLVYSGKINFPQKQIQTTEVDETANWKTYTNNKYKYSFRYPESVTITTRVETLPGNEAERQIESTCCIAVWKDAYKEILFSLDTFEEQKSLEEYKKNLLTEGANNMVDIIFLGEKAISYQYNPLSPSSPSSITLIRNKILYDFLPTDPLKIDVELKDQILPTFKFIPQ